MGGGGVFFFFKQKTAYEIYQCDWSSDVCSSDLALLNSLKKNDRIVTVGGIYGVVTNVQKDADEVTVKIDESNNIKVRITFGSVARVINGEANGDKQGKS